MADKLILFEALAPLVSALNAGIALANQKAGAADAATTAANAATAASLAQSTTTATRTTETIAARDSAIQAATNSIAQTALAAQATTAAQTAASNTTAIGNTAQQQADYAKTQGDAAKTAAANVGNMTKAVYDTDNSGAVDNAERLGGLTPANYARATVGGQERLGAIDARTILPTNISASAGYGRFRLGTVADNGTTVAPFADIIDLSTGTASGTGGVNSLYFRKDQSRITHKFGVWAGSTWFSARDLAYLDEVTLKGEGVTRDGSIAMTGQLQLAASGIKFPADTVGATGDFASMYLGKVSDTATGENLELRIEVGNDSPLDRISLRPFNGTTIDPNGAFVGNNVIWNAGNFDPSLKAPLNAPSFTGNVTVGGNVLSLGNAATLTTAASSLTVATGTGRDLLLAPQTGRVGIGQASPAYPLDVNGAARFTGSLLASSFNSDSAFSFTTIAGVPQQLNAGQVRVGSLAGDPGTAGLSVKGDVLAQAAVRLQYAPVFEGTSRNSLGVFTPGLSNGLPLNPDSSFKNGANGVTAYNNSGNAAVTVTRVAGVANPGNRSGYVLSIRWDSSIGTAAPGIGGFVQLTQARQNAQFVHRFRAKVAVGATLNCTSNSIGTNGALRWLTPQAGTGKWEEYAYLIQCGDSGSFSSFGHVYITGPTTTFEWYVEDACVYDITTNGVNELMSTGGTFSGAINAPSVNATTITPGTTLNLPAISPASFIAGSGDGATYATHNLRMHLHWGLGMESYDGTINGLYDARQGRWTVKGGLTIDDGTNAVALSKSAQQSLTVQTPFGYVQIGPQTTNNAHFQTDRAGYSYDKPISIDTGAFTVKSGGNIVSTLGPTSGTINNQAIVTTNDARLKDWGVFSTSGQDFLGRGGRALVAGADASNNRNILYLNYGGDFPTGVQVLGPSLTVAGTLGASGLAAFYGGATLQSGTDLVMQAGTAVPADAGDIIFRTNGGGELARIFSSPTGQLTLRPNGDDAAAMSLNPASVTALKPFTDYRDSGTIAADLYSRSNFIAQTATTGGIAAYGWHNTGQYALSVYLHPSEGRLRIRDSSNNDYLLLTTKDVEEAQVTGNRSTLLAPNVDANVQRPSGRYRGSGLLNMPVNATWFYLNHHQHDDAAYASQMAQHYFSEDLYLRRRDANVWQPWQRVWHTGNFNPAGYMPLSGGTINGSFGITGGLQVNGATNVNGALTQAGQQVYHTGNLDPNALSRLKITAADQNAVGDAYPAGTMYISDYTPAANGIPDSSLLTFRGDANVDSLFQIAKGWGVTGSLYHRHANSSASGTFGAWKTIWDSGNFNPASYLGLAGGTITGSLTVNGSVTSTDFFKSSSRALKGDIKPYEEDALAEIAKLDIVTYTYNADMENKPQVGIIADDVKNPLISGVAHDVFDTANALAIALKAIQQLLKRVEELEAR